MKLEREGGVKNIVEEKKASDAEIAAALRAKGIDVQVNEEGAIADKRDLLNAGLNVIPSGKAGDGNRSADHLRANRPAQSAFPRKDVGSREAQRERQSRMVEEQLEAAAKRKREEEDEQREKEERAAKSKKTQKGCEGGSSGLKTLLLCCLLCNHIIDRLLIEGDDLLRSVPTNAELIHYPMTCLHR
jgi:hypothetical protein